MDHNALQKLLQEIRETVRNRPKGFVFEKDNYKACIEGLLKDFPVEIEGDDREVLVTIKGTRASLLYKPPEKLHERKWSLTLDAPVAHHSKISELVHERLRNEPFGDYDDEIEDRLCLDLRKFLPRDDYKLTVLWLDMTNPDERRKVIVQVFRKDESGLSLPKAEDMLWTDESGDPDPDCFRK